MQKLFLMTAHLESEPKSEDVLDVLSVDCTMIITQSCSDTSTSCEAEKQARHSFGLCHGCCFPPNQKAADKAVVLALHGPTTKTG